MKAHQRKIREQIAEQDSDFFPLFGKYWESLDINIKKTIVKPIDYKTAEKIILKYEWLGTMPTYSTHYFGIYFDGVCGGVVIFGISLPRSVLESICGKEYLEKVRVLSRGACVHWTPIGSASKLIGESIKILKQEGYKIIIAYSDVRAGEIGTIYQACNFLYTGKSIGGQETLIDNKWRTRMPRCVIENKIDTIDLPKRERSIKHRYIYLMGSKKEKKILKNNLRYEVLPYPKRID